MDIRRRLRQVMHWVRDTYALPKPVWVRWRPELEGGKTLGMTHFGAQRDTIVLSKKLLLASRSLAVDTLLHEIAHCLTGEEHPEHGDRFWKLHGDLYRAFVEEGGAEASSRYPAGR